MHMTMPLELKVLDLPGVEHPKGSLERVTGPLVSRGHAVEDSPAAFRRLLASANCYGNLGAPIACPKSKSLEGLELSNRPWRDAPLDDIHALWLTGIANKQLVKYVRGGGPASVGQGRWATS